VGLGKYESSDVESRKHRNEQRDIRAMRKDEIEMAKKRF
jgi:hypothetical protein